MMQLACTVYGTGLSGAAAEGRWTVGGRLACKRRVRVREAVGLERSDWVPGGANGVSVTGVRAK